MKLFLPVLLGCFALTSLPARAADEKKDDSAAASGTTLDQFKLGETIANDPATMDSLKGKVVVIELWGIH
jgi:hypothetical protein